MESNAKAFSIASYLSIFFLPLLFPLIIWLAVSNPEVKYHSKRALLSHIVSTVISLVLIVIIIFSFISLENSTSNFPLVVAVIAIILVIILEIAVIVWNIVQAVKVAK